LNECWKNINDRKFKAQYQLECILHGKCEDMDEILANSLKLTNKDIDEM
jgi:hypothetical protein